MEIDKREEEKKKRKKKKEGKVKLSFAMDDDEEQEDNGDSRNKRGGETSSSLRDDRDESELSSKRLKLGKNPSLDTSFLPDRERDEAERKERDILRKEWLVLQEKTKAEDIEITYSYWDGSGHRKVVTVRPLLSRKA